MPLTEICTAEYSEPRQRQLYKNIVYVGALAALLDIDIAVVETLIAEQFKGKDRLIAANLEALEIGCDDARSRFRCPLGIRVARSDAVGDRILAEGNFAAGARRGLWRRDRLRLVSDHALDLARRGLRAQLRSLRTDKDDRQEELRDRPGGGRDRRDRRCGRRWLERRPRLHHDIGARASRSCRNSSASPISPRFRSSCSMFSAAARRPACRPAPSSRTCSSALSPRTATPSMCS